MSYTNADPEPWAPDTGTDIYPGTAPSAAGRGERGSSVFAGTSSPNSGYNTDGTPKDYDVPPRGPATGEAYYPDGDGSTTTAITSGVQVARVIPGV